MKKRMAMTVLALAVSAMAGSAFAADDSNKTAPQHTIKAQLIAKPAISLEQMAKEKGITVEELIAQLKKDNQLATATATTASTASVAADKDGKTTPMMKAMNLEDMAKEQGITVEDLIAQLKKDGQMATVTATTTSTASVAADKDGKATPMMKVINLEDMAKEKGITVEELIAQLEKEGKLADAVKLVPATPIQK